MITRPLNLSSRLRPPPRNFDSLFYVSVGLTALMFALFGSRFVLSPGLGVDFKLPVMPTALAGAAAADVIIAIKGTDLIFVEGAKVDSVGLRSWLIERAKGHPGLRLLVQADVTLTTKDLTSIYDMAHDAGFVGVQIAAEPSEQQATP